jgi:hypothetical protein
MVMCEGSWSRRSSLTAEYRTTASCRTRLNRPAIVVRCTPVHWFRRYRRDQSADCPQKTTVTVKQGRVGPVGWGTPPVELPGEGGLGAKLRAGDCGLSRAFVSSDLSRSTFAPVGSPFMSLLSAIIAWLVSGLPGRPSPALVRTRFGGETGRRWRPECAWSLVAWQHAKPGPPRFWKSSDRQCGGSLPGSCVRRAGSRAFRQWVGRR